MFRTCMVDATRTLRTLHYLVELIFGSNQPLLYCENFPFVFRIYFPVVQSQYTPRFVYTMEVEIPHTEEALIFHFFPIRNCMFAFYMNPMFLLSFESTFKFLLWFCRVRCPYVRLPSCMRHGGCFHGDWQSRQFPLLWLHQEFWP